MLMKVIGGSLNVREKPTTESEVKHILAEGEEITVGKEENGWCKFGSGYVMVRWLEPAEKEDAALVIKTGEDKPKKAAGKSKKKAAAK